MSGKRRVTEQPAYILHHRPFQDSSRILDVLTRDYGKIALVARGSRSAKSKLAGILRPFMPLRIAWVGRSELGTLTGAEGAGRPFGLTGDATLSAYYLSELLLNLMHRHDPQPEVFDLYENALGALLREADVALTLRRFEIELLSLLGYALNLDATALEQAPIQADRHYEYRIEQGAVEVARAEGAMVFRGAELIAIAEQDFADPTVVRAAGRLLRPIIDWHLGGKALNSRKVMRDLHRGRIAPSKNKE